MGREIEELAQFVAATRWQDVPPPVQHHTKLVLLDTLGVMLAGSERPEVRELRDRLVSPCGRGATVYARGWPLCDPRLAALLNGIAGRAIELCEGLRLASGQAAVQILPGLLALGEHLGSSGRELLAAFVLGYEVAARLAEGFTPRERAHQNGQVPLLTPSYRNAIAGATALNVAGGASGLVATLAPELALAGFTAQEEAIEEALGQLVGAGFTTAGLTEALGRRWGITRNYFRLHACCNPIHPALDCLAEILAELRPQPGEIARIEIATYRFAALMNSPDPPNYFAAKYSLPHAAATMVVRGHAGFAALDDSALSDPAIAALRRRVEVVEDAAMSALVPRLRPARVTVRLGDGRQSTRSRDSHRGDFEHPFTAAELRAKFRELAGTVLTGEGAAAVAEAIDHSEEWPNLAVLTALLRRHENAEKP